MFKKTLITVSMLSFLAACAGPSATQGVTKAEQRSGGFLGLSKSADIKVNTAKAFAGANEVIIGSFIVGFSIKKTDSAKAGGGLMGSGFGGKSTARSLLVGIDDATMQQITDQLYEEFVKGLEARGYTVADRAQLLEHDSFKKTKKMNSPYEDNSDGLFGKGSISKYFGPAKLGSIAPFMGDIPGVTGGFGFSNPAVGASEFANKTGKKVIHAVYVVDFANSDKYGSWATSSSTVNVGQGLSVIPDISKISIIGGYAGTFSSANGSVVLGQPTMSEKPFADVTDATSDAAMAGEIAANVIGLIGGVGTNKSRNFEFKARPDDFKAATLDAVGQANKALLDKMASLR